jgi:hypothetical protein
MREGGRGGEVGRGKAAATMELPLRRSPYGNPASSSRQPRPLQVLKASTLSLS